MENENFSTSGISSGPAKFQLVHSTITVPAILSLSTRTKKSLRESKELTALCPMQRGRLIVIEGLDRSGKSTQCQLLQDQLCDTLTTTTTGSTLQKFPDRTTTIGKMIDSYLKSESELDDHAIHLLFSANRWERAEFIREELKAGRHVILDRYIYSGITFSVIKGLDRDWCRACDLGLPEPDLIFFLNLDEQVAAQRGGFGQERYELAETQRKVRAEFMTLFDGMEDSVQVIDASRTIVQVQEEIWTTVTRELQRTKEEPVRSVTWKHTS